MRKISKFLVVLPTLVLAATVALFAVGCDDTVAQAPDSGTDMSMEGGSNTD